MFQKVSDVNCVCLCHTQSFLSIPQTRVTLEGVTQINRTGCVYSVCMRVAVIGTLNPPTLETASSELVFSAGDNFTIKCYGDLPLNWTYPVNKVCEFVFFRLQLSCI